jgi:hypothetical protein
MLWGTIGARRKKHLLILADVVVPVSDATSTLTAATFAPDADGSTTDTITYTAKDASDVALPDRSVTLGVERLFVSAGNSVVTVDKTTLESDGVDSCTVSITVADNGQAVNDNDQRLVPGIAAAAVVIAVDGTDNTITQPAAITGIGGSTSGSFVSTQAGVTKTITVTVAGQLLEDAPTVVMDGSITPPAPGDPFFEDTFAGPGFNPANGFTWDTSDQVEAVSFDGRDCARVDYLTPGGSGTLRFNMGQELAEGWIEYDFYVPSNFTHDNDSPNNNKFFQFWRTTYSDVAGGTWRFGCEYTTNSGTTPNSNIRWMSSRYDSNSNDSSGMGMPDNGTPFIGGSGPIPKETWKQIRIHWKASTDRVTADGVLQMWIDGVLSWSQTDGKFNNFNASPADCWIQNGYLMGAANAMFPDNPTYFYIDEFKAYDTDPGW